MENPTLTKVCGRCKIDRPLTEYRPRNSKTTTLRSQCKLCDRECAQICYWKNPDKSRKAARQWEINNPERKRAQILKRYLGNPAAFLLMKARERAKSKGRPFNIVVGDIVMPEFCPVLGIKLERNKKQHGVNSPTLDCLIPEKGYVKGNVAVISFRANSLKSDATLDELQKLTRWVKKALKSEPSSSKVD